MKITKLVIIAAVLMLFSTALHSFAVDGLRLSVQSTNVSLYWPSTEGESFVVQYRHSLSETDVWQTLAPSLPAATGTNFTSYTHYGIVQYPPDSSGGGEFASESMATTTTVPFVPMVKRTNDPRSAVPLGIYPPGFDLSGYVIFEPTTGEWVSGDGYFVDSFRASRAQAYGFQPMDDQGVESSSPPDTGFYRVLGVRLTSGLTNGMTASDFLNIQTRPEYGGKYLELMANGQAFPFQDLLVAPFADTNSVTFQYVDTAYLSNGGPYSLQVEGAWFLPSEASIQTRIIPLPNSMTCIC